MNKIYSMKSIYLITVAVFAIGLSLTSSWLQYSEKKHIHALETKFNQYSLQAFNVIQNLLNRELERLNSLSAVFTLSDKVTQADFDILGKSLLDLNSGIQTIEWIEVIPAQNIDQFKAEMRKKLSLDHFVIKQNAEGRLDKQIKENDAYAIVKYVYPYVENKLAIGIDAYANEAQRVAMHAAASARKQVATVPLNNAQGSNQDQSVIIYQPVYNGSDKLLGFTAIVLNLGHYFKFIRSNLLIEKSLRLSQLASLNSTQSFVSVGPNYSKKDALFRSKQHYLNFAGQDWFFDTSVNLKSLPDYNALQGWPINKVWIDGILISLLFSVVVFLFLKYLYQLSRNQGSLQEQENRYHKIIDQSSEAYFLMNCDGEILDVNNQTCHLLGYEREELLQKKINQIDIKYTPEEIANICRDFDPGTRVLFETIHQRKNGTSVPVEVAATKFKVDGDWVTCAFARDMSERISNKALTVDNEELQRAIEIYTKQLNEQKKTFETLFEKTADGVFITEGRHVLDCNQAVVDMFGYESKQKLLSLPNSVFAPKYQPDGESSHRKGYRMLQLCLTKGTHHYEWLNRRANGEEFWTDVVLTQLEYYGRKVIHVALRDISERKILEEAMYLAREEAVSANKAKSDFLATMSHDIRTPLHGILSYAEMGMSRIGSISEETTKRYFNNIQLSGLRLIGLLDNLLDSAKLESGLMSFDFNYQTIEPVIESCLLEQQSLINDKELNVELKHIDFMAYFDAHRIAQVISNLLSNAIVYSPKGSTITLSVENIQSESLVFSIQNEGKGINDGDLDTIFNKFVQSKNAYQSAGGSGLGLAISKEIIDAHDGKIWAENWNENGVIKGVIFRFTLPARSPDRMKYV
ncbi:PAS domain S-box protein [Thiomicrorhabdus sp.]|uniref:PAS domain S-box protein n=1 Tax=Thiomicrorhabdus sp. TaxID=2039724 RepID=UPI002AA8EB5D|nr:PAS domain S-box protein [Thiomicrorhabdus sp.]